VQCGGDAAVRWQRRCGGSGGAVAWIESDLSVGESAQSSVRAPVFNLNPNVTLLPCFQNSRPTRNFFRNRVFFRDHMSQPGIWGTEKLNFFSFRVRFTD
jgi:hypothetical protein